MRSLFVLMVMLLCPAAVAHAITAQSWVVANEHGHILQGENLDQVRPIASITKLMTVIVVLDAQQDLDEVLSVKQHPLKRLTRQQLIDLALVKSDNAASDALCSYYPGGYTKCIAAMNHRADELGLLKTNFVDATGLNAGNVSTARELIKLTNTASFYPAVVAASQKSQVKIEIRKRWFVFNNTNPIIGRKHEFVVSKTGYIRAAGGCIVMLVKTEKGIRTVVVLGSQPIRARIPDADFIASSF